MASLWAKGFSTTVGALAITGGIYYAQHRQRVSESSTSEKNAITASALTLTSDLVDGVFRDDKIMNLVGDVVVKAFLHPAAIESLKVHFQHEFTENEETVSALKSFVVDKVILDQWVSDHLVEMSILLGNKLLMRPEIWPTGTCDLLKDAALEALVQESFLDAAKNHAYTAMSRNGSSARRST